jgi:hypothetical protein
MRGQPRHRRLNCPQTNPTNKRASQSDGFAFRQNDSLAAARDIARSNRSRILVNTCIKGRASNTNRRDE